MSAVSALASPHTVELISVMYTVFSLTKYVLGSVRTENVKRPLLSAHSLNFQHREDHAEAAPARRLALSKRSVQRTEGTGKPAGTRSLRMELQGKVWNILKLSTQKQLGICTQESREKKFVGQDGRGGMEREGMEKRTAHQNLCLAEVEEHGLIKARQAIAGGKGNHNKQKSSRKYK